MPHVFDLSSSALRAATLSLMFLVCSCFAQTAILLSPDAADVLSRQPDADRKALRAFGDLPLSFEPNLGQADLGAKFLSLGNSGVVFKSSEVVIASSAQSAEPVRLRFLNAQTNARLEGLDRLPGESNYLIGQTPSGWIPHVPTFGTVRYIGLYPGIDARFHGTQNQLEYDFVVSPGADSRQIRIRFEGARLRSELKGDVLIQHDGVEIRQRRPIAYQESRGIRTEVAVRAVITAQDELSFILSDYNHALSVTIDPALDYSATLGGRLAQVNAIAADFSGNVYLAGLASSDFSPTPGAFQTTYGGNDDAFVMKLDPTGSTVVYATFLGGGGHDFANAIAIDEAGNAYVAGTTGSLDFPITNGAFQANLNPEICEQGPPTVYCSDSFFTELNSSGSALIYSTYLGGSGNDSASAIVVDGSGKAYITGQAGAPDFPTTPGAFQTTFSKGAECFISKVDPSKAGAASLVYSTFLGGPVDDGVPRGSGLGIAVDSADEAVAVGVTTSSTFATPGAFKTQNPAGSPTGFVAKVNNSGSALVFATYLGGTLQSGRWDEATAVAVDSSANSYVTGAAWTEDFPTTPGAFQTTFKAFNGSSAFITKLNPQGAALVYSTLLSGSTNAIASEYDEAFGIKIDASGNAYVAGITGDLDFPMTPISLEPVCGYNPFSGFPFCSSFVTVLNPTGASLVFSTYIGANPGPNATPGLTATAMALDGSNRIYVGGGGNTSDLPIVGGPPTTGGGWVARIDLAEAAPAVALLPTSIDFGGVQINTTVQSTATLSNRGDAPLFVSSINISGNAYSQINNCPPSLDPAASCNITISFSPNELTYYGGQLTVTDNAFDNPHYVTVSGSGGIASAGLSTSSLTFDSQSVGTTSPFQPVQLTDSGTAGLTISSITTSGDFAQSNNCGQSIMQGKSCTINVVFAPTKLGVLSGSLTITDEASNSPQQVLLGGTGTPPVLGLGIPSGHSDSATVTAGSTASYTLSIGGSGLSGTASLTCTGAPAGATCSVPGSESVGATTASTFNVTVSTTGTSAALPQKSSSVAWLWATALIGMVMLPTGRHSRRLARRTAAVLSLLLVTFLASCGGGGNGGGGGSGGTPAGTYTLTVTATMGGKNQSQKLQLKVN